MIQLHDAQVAEWLAKQGWLSLPSPSSWRFDVSRGIGLKHYECKIAEGSPLVGCNMARVFLHDIEPPRFPGGLFWIVRTFPPDEDMLLFSRQLLRGTGIGNLDCLYGYFALREDEYETCFALCALALMFGWDANFVAAERRFLFVMDDEPFPALITDSVSSWFEEIATNLDFKISDLP